MQTQTARQFSAQELKKGEWVLLISNHFTFSPVHAFSLSIKGFQYLFPEYRGNGSWRYNHAARVKDGQVIEMVGKGRIVTPVDEWLTRANRTVAVAAPLLPFAETTGSRYGYYDIPQIVLHKLRAKAGLGHSWNGKDGVPLAGLFCSEEVMQSLGHASAFTYLPADLFTVPVLNFTAVITTVKK